MLHLQVLDISIVPKYWCSCIYTHNYVIFLPTRKFFTNMETALGANVLFAISAVSQAKPPVRLLLSKFINMPFSWHSSFTILIFDPPARSVKI